MSAVQQPLISIITPSFNASGTIGDMLESLLPQLSDDIEHLLIDACSSDGTLDIARQYPHLTILSERDRGIYDGMNKGAALAKGDWILFLQADDWLPAGTLEAYRKAISESAMASVICGSAEAVKESEGCWSTVWSVTETSRKLLTAENLALGEPMINARLFKRNAFELLGGFSLEYSLASDRDFLLHATETGMIQHEVDARTYRYRWHSGSSTMTEGNALSSKLSQENLAIAKKHLRTATGSARQALRKWHDYLTVQAGMNALEEYRLGGLIRAFKAGISENPGWPACFIKEVLRSLPGFLSRGGKTKSQILKKERLDQGKSS
jgi:glycosyltransferase involved in cell wall biosynthesis